jgi:hypothetical protein
MHGLELDDEQMSLLDRLSENNSSVDSLIENLPNLNNAAAMQVINSVMNPEEEEKKENDASMNSAHEEDNSN